MTTYCVKWGTEEATISAENESDAWAKFCDGHIQAQRTPHAFERSIEEAKAPPAETKKPKTK